MKKVFFSIFIGFFFLGSCKTVQDASNPSSELVISMRKTACKGMCPEYYMEIFSNGEIRLLGKRNIELIGKYRKKISNNQLVALVNKFREANFFEFKDEYTASVTDLPTTYLHFTDGENSKRVRDYYGAPPELKMLESELEKFISNGGWEKVE